MSVSKPTRQVLNDAGHARPGFVIYRTHELMEAEKCALSSIAFQREINRQRRNGVVQELVIMGSLMASPHAPSKQLDIQGG